MKIIACLLILAVIIVVIISFARRTPEGQLNVDQLKHDVREFGHDAQETLKRGADNAADAAKDALK